MLQPETFSDLSQVTLAVLAGGAGTRMGIPKANLTLAGKPILQWLLEQIHWPGPRMLVVSPASTDPPGAEHFDRQVIDPVGGLGPLRGILTTLECMDTSSACVLTVDMPMIRRDLLALLVQSANAHEEKAGVLFEISSAAVRRIEPFPSLFRASARSLIEDRVKTERRSVRRLCQEPEVLTIKTPDNTAPDVWTNLNYPAEFARFEASLDTIAELIRKSIS